MSKLIKITLGIALAFLVVGCESSEAKSSSNSTQTRQVEQQQNTKEQQYKRLVTGALETIQNRSFANYQNMTFKQMFDKWTNFCANVEWDITRVTTLDLGDNEQAFAVTAYCEIKDFETTKANIQKYVVGKYKELDFQHSGLDESNEDTHKYYERSPINVVSKNLSPLIPGGMGLINKKMNDNQRRKVFDYLMDKVYMSFTEALEKSDKIYIAYPFLVVGKYYERDDEFEYKYNARGITEFGNSTSSVYDDVSILENNFGFHSFRIAFGIDGQKMFVRNYPLYTTEIDIAELMFFNKSVDFLSFNIKDRIGIRDRYDRISDKILAPIAKKIFYNKQEQEQFFKDFAAEIVKIYSESN